MLVDILNDSIEGSKELAYDAEVEDHGGVEAVAKHLCSLVSPEVKCLSGREVTTQMLQEVRQEQVTTPWKGAGGYLDFVTDDRRNDWLRFYAGQFKDPVRRILRQHSESILKGSCTSLHYFMIWMGNGHRTANFIRLWQFPESETLDQWYQIRANILEALFCKAFRSTQGFLTGDKIASGHYGLNVMTPLIQGGGQELSYFKLKASKAMSKSPDRQIRAWPKFRQAFMQKREVLRTNHRPLFRPDFTAALNNAIPDDRLLQAITDSLATAVTEERLTGNKEDPSLKSFIWAGNMAARIGFVVSHESCPPTIGQQHGHSAKKDTSLAVDQLPWSLTICGFNTSNTIVWTPNFNDVSILDVEGLHRMFETVSADASALEKHAALISASRLRVIFLCGVLADHTIRNALGLSQRFMLELRGYKYPMYVDDGTASGIARLFVRCPELPANVRTVSTTAVTRLSEVLRFRVSVASLAGIRPYFIETSCIQRSIISRVALERNGYPKLTTDALDEGLRAWLSRKGIDRVEDIRKIETTAGSLSWGLLMVLSALPRPKTRSVIPGPSAPRKRKNERFDDEAFRSIKKHITDLTDRHRRERDEKFRALGGVGALASSTSQSQESPSPPTMPSSHFGPKGDLLEPRHGQNFGYVDEVQNILETSRMDSKNQLSLEHKDSLSSHADHPGFEPEQEAEKNFRQLASVAMDHELDPQNGRGHTLGRVPDMLTIEKTPNLPVKDKNPSVSDLSQLDLPMKKTRKRGPNIIPVEQKDLDGSKIRVSDHGEIQIRYYRSEGSLEVEKLTWKSGPSLIPAGPEDTRTIHFTTEGIDIRNAAGETIYLRTRRPSNSKATFPKSVFTTYTIGGRLLKLWEEVTRLRQSLSTQSTSK